MVDPTVAVDQPPPYPPPTAATNEFDSALDMPPLDPAFFSQHLGPAGNCDSNSCDQQNDVVIDDLDFDFSFDDLYLPASDLDDLLLSPIQNPSAEIEPVPFNPNYTGPGSGNNLDQFPPNSTLNNPASVFKSSYFSGDLGVSGDRSSNDSSGISNSALPAAELQQISGYLNVPSPESDGSNRGSSNHCDLENVLDGERVLDCPSPESQGSGNCGSNVSQDSNNCARSVSSSPNSNSSSSKIGVVDQKVKLEEPLNRVNKNSMNNNLALKRKNTSEDSLDNNSESRTNKCSKSSSNVEISDNNNGGLSEEEEKRKARLMRNRESAQLSRQRKKHYVEELEDKVRTMHSTIQDLNSKISYFMAENASLRQQLGGGSSAVPPPPVAPPPPGMYPHPPMMYPWMPCMPPYVMKPQGSQIPLVPIPRLKPQQASPAPKANKKTESKKTETVRTKKVAGVSFLGLLFFIMLFGGLVPMVNVRYGGMKDAFTGGEGYYGSRFYEEHRGRVLMVNGNSSSSNNIHCSRRDHNSGGDPIPDEFVHSGNGSEPLVASLYVPRNDKLVKIDGNLIIHSVLASEKAMASRDDHETKAGGETGLAVRGDLAPAIPVPAMGRNGVRHPHLRALGSSSADKENLKSSTSDRRLQQWFREGLAGPMLSSGVCTEVFQFDVSSASPSGAIVSSSTTANTSAEHPQNTTNLNKGRNRRILHGLPIPLPGSSNNISKEHAGRTSEKENLSRKNTSMVVSVLVDPREAGDADADGVLGPKSLSRVFVVVLIDSVKYVTYSCILPFKGTANLVTT